MGIISSEFGRVYRDDNVAGVPASGTHDPVKAEIRDLALLIEGGLAAAAASGADMAAVEALIEPLLASALAASASSANSAATAKLIQDSLRPIANDLALGSQSRIVAIAADLARADQSEIRRVLPASQAAVAAALSAGNSASLAATAALTAPNVYSTTAAGLAAVAEGQTFWAMDKGKPVLYRDVAGTAVRLAGLLDGASRTTITLSNLTAPDGKLVEFIAATAGSAQITSPAGLFAAADVGKRIKVTGAGAGGADLFTSVLSFQSANQVTLAQAVPTGTTTGGAILGTDCGPALQAAFDTVMANGGGTIIVDETFYFETPVLKNFGLSGTIVTIQGTDTGGALLVAGNAAADMLMLQNCKVFVDRVSFVGCPLAFTDCRRLFDVVGDLFLDRNGFFGLSVAGAIDAGLIRIGAGRLRMKDNEFGGCIAEQGRNTNIIDVNDFQAFESQDNRFIDYGTWQGSRLSKTGLAFCQSWVRIRNPLDNFASTNAGSVVRMNGDQFDEGCFIAVLIQPDLDRVIEHVKLTGLRVNNTQLDGGSAVGITRSESVIVEQLSIGWSNLPHAGLVLDSCGDVLVEAPYITAGAPGPIVGLADELYAVNVRNLRLRNARAFARRTFINVGAVQEIIDGVGGVVPYTKRGRITDADFVRVTGVAPQVGTVGFDAYHERLYVRTDSGWRATLLAESVDPMVALNNLTPATVELTDAVTANKTSGGSAWNATARLDDTVTGGFRMRVRFLGATLGDVAVGATSNTGVISFDDLIIGLVSRAAQGDVVYVATGTPIDGTPGDPGDVFQMTYDAVAGTIAVTRNGAASYTRLAPAAITPTTAHFFSSGIFSEDGGFELLEYVAL